MSRDPFEKGKVWYQIARMARGAEEIIEQGRDNVVRSCGNLIVHGPLRPGPSTREVREHPACGRKPNRIVTMEWTEQDGT